MASEAMYEQEWSIRQDARLSCVTTNTHAIDNITNPARHPPKVPPCARGDGMRVNQTREKEIEFELKHEVLENDLTDTGNENSNENDDTILGRSHNEKIFLSGKGQNSEMSPVAQ